MESKIETAPWVTAPGQWEPGAIRWCFYDCNVLGDPALAVYTDNPIPINTTLPVSVDIGASSMNINVTSTGSAAPGLTCVVMKDGIKIGESITNYLGQAVINFEIMVQDTGEAQLIVSGYNCKPASYSFSFTGNYTGTDALASVTDNLVISPNPATEMIHVNVMLAAKCKFTLQLFNSEGKVIISTKESIPDNNGRNSQVIDISELKAGYYTCRLKSGKITVSRPFIVK
jgi:hypothetical protein